MSFLVGVRRGIVLQCRTGNDESARHEADRLSPQKVGFSSVGVEE